MSVLLDEYFKGKAEVERLGFNIKSPQYIPQGYLDQKFFVVFRTCQSYGDWVQISCIPRFLKTKYPDSTVVVPSPVCIGKYFSPQNWLNRSSNPFDNVIQVNENNPYIDGMIDEIPNGMPVYHDHFRIHDLDNMLVPLSEQILKYWRFDPKEITNSAPELYWDDTEKIKGESAIQDFIGELFGFLYIDDSFYETIDGNIPPLTIKRERLQFLINQFDNGITWVYYAGKDISETFYKTKGKAIDVRSLGISLRVQQYIKSKSKLVIGHQGGYGTDAISRYTDCYVIPLNCGATGEHFIRTTEYIPHP